MLYFRWLIFLGLTILSIIGIVPTVEYYSNYFGKDNLNNDVIIDNQIETLKNKSLTLGLDLQGGIHMVLELDLVDLFINLINDELLKRGFRMDRGYGKLRGDAFRIAHMGNIMMDDLSEYLQNFNEVLDV